MVSAIAILVSSQLVAVCNGVRTSEDSYMEHSSRGAAVTSSGYLHMQKREQTAEEFLPLAAASMGLAGMHTFRLANEGDWSHDLGLSMHMSPDLSDSSLDMDLMHFKKWGDTITGIPEGDFLKVDVGEGHGNPMWRYIPMNIPGSGAVSDHRVLFDDTMQNVHSHMEDSLGVDVGAQMADMAPAHGPGVVNRGMEVAKRLLDPSVDRYIGAQRAMLTNGVRMGGPGMYYPVFNNFYHERLQGVGTPIVDHAHELGDRAGGFYHSMLDAEKVVDRAKETVEQVQENADAITKLSEKESRHLAQQAGSAYDVLENFQNSRNKNAIDDYYKTNPVGKLPEDLLLQAGNEYKETGMDLWKSEHFPSKMERPELGALASPDASYLFNEQTSNPVDSSLHSEAKPLHQAMPTHDDKTDVDNVANHIDPVDPLTGPHHATHRQLSLQLGLDSNSPLDSLAVADEILAKQAEQRKAPAPRQADPLAGLDHASHKQLAFQLALDGQLPPGGPAADEVEHAEQRVAPVTLQNHHHHVTHKQLALQHALDSNFTE